MPVVRLDTFSGTLPLRSARALPDANAAQAVNIRPEAGGLQGVRGPSLIKTLQGSTRSVYRILTGSVPDLVGGSFWMEFSDQDTDVHRTPVVNDQYERYYWCSPSTGPRYNTKTRITSGSTNYVLGFDAPVAPPTLVLTGGGADPTDIVTREYVFTYVSIYGEESAPSPAAEASGYTDSFWYVYGIPIAPTGTLQVPITTVRIYRTVTGLTGVTSFYKVADVAPGATFFYDYLGDETLITEIESTTWAKPVSGLQGLVALPGGFFASWTGNTIYFSEPYHPHAWPAEYALTVEHPIVGLGVYGSTLVVCTSGFPYRVNGIRPDTMSLVKLGQPMPCLNRRSIVSTPQGVYFASEDGIAFVGSAGMGIVTHEVIGRDVWQTQFNATATWAIALGQSYVFRQTVPNTSTDIVYAMAPESPGLGLTQITVPGSSLNVPLMDHWSGRALLIADGSLYEWINPRSTSVLTYRWRSREFQLPKPGNLGAAEMSFARPNNNETVTLRIWADGTKVFDQSISVTDKPIRLPSGFMATVWQFEVESSAQLYYLAVGKTVADLRNA
jgi:hypothetical protein